MRAVRVETFEERVEEEVLWRERSVAVGGGVRGARGGGVRGVEKGKRSEEGR